MGSRNATVFPVPVRALATTSLPARSGGIEAVCTGVAVFSPMAATLFLSASLMGSSENCSSVASTEASEPLSMRTEPSL